MKVIEYFKSWTFDRYFRIIIAAMIAAYAIDSEQYGLLLASGWFGFLAFTNISCCGVGGCKTTPKQKNTETQNEEITINYEEIK